MALLRREGYHYDRHDFEEDDSSHVLLGYREPENQTPTQPGECQSVLYLEKALPMVESHGVWPSIYNILATTIRGAQML